MGFKNKNKLKNVAIAAVVFTSLALATPLSAASLYGTFRVERGEASIYRNDQVIKVTAVDKAVKVYDQDLIRIGDDSKAHLDGNEKASVQMGSNAVVKVKSWDEKSSKGFLSLLYGKIRATIAGLTPKESFNVKTANSIIGVKGTEYAGGVDNQDNSFVWSQEHFVYYTDVRSEQQLIVPQGYYSANLSGEGLQRMVPVAVDVPMDDLASTPPQTAAVGAPSEKSNDLDKFYVKNEAAGSVADQLPQIGSELIQEIQRGVTNVQGGTSTADGGKSTINVTPAFQ